MKVKDDLLYIAHSNLAGCGMGLFTSAFISKGEKICEFTGRLLGEKEFSQILEDIKCGVYDLRACNYFVSLSSGFIIDSYESGCFARFANDAEGLRKFDPYKNNAKIMEDAGNNSAFLEALEDIRPGEEIFTSYGKAYWEGFMEDKG